MFWIKLLLPRTENTVAEKSNFTKHGVTALGNMKLLGITAIGTWIYCLKGNEDTVLGNTKKKVKSSMARSLPVENLLPQNVGSIINCLQ